MCYFKWQENVQDIQIQWTEMTLRYQYGITGSSMGLARAKKKNYIKEVVGVP